MSWKWRPRMSGMGATLANSKLKILLGAYRRRVSLC